MKLKYSLIVISLFLIVLFFVMKNYQDEEPERSKKEVVTKKLKRKGVVEDSLQVNNIDISNRKLVPKFDLALERVQEPKNANTPVYPQYRVGGTSGGRLTIRNLKGKLLLRGSDKVSVYAAKGSPTGKMIWVLSGDGKSFVINDKGMKLIDLPQFPFGKGMHAFSRWHWIGDNKLLGESGVQKYDEQGKLVTCCGGDTVSESRFYVYDVQTKQMEEMRLPENLQGKVLNIGKSLKTGELQLGHKGDGFEWYQVVNAD